MKRDCIFAGRLKCLFATLCNFALCSLDCWFPALGLETLGSIQYISKPLRALESGAETVLSQCYSSQDPLLMLCLDRLPSQGLASVAFCTECHQGCDFNMWETWLWGWGSNWTRAPSLWGNSQNLWILCEIITTSLVVLTGSCYCVLVWTLCSQSVWDVALNAPARLWSLSNTLQFQATGNPGWSPPRARDS